MQIAPGRQIRKKSAILVVDPPVATEAQASAALIMPAESSTSRQSQAGSNSQTVGAVHRWDDLENHTPKVEWFIGYSLRRAMPTSFSNRMGYLRGGSISVTYNLNRYFGLMADFGGYDNTRLTVFSPTGSQTVDSNGSA